jgi:hypothetical protein
MQILPENVKILTWILHDFFLNFTVGGVSKPSILLTMVGVNTPGPCWTKTFPYSYFNFHLSIGKENITTT